MFCFSLILQTTNSEFCKAKASNQSAGKREAMLKDLAAGFDMYIELTDNLKEGTKVTLGFLLIYFILWTFYFFNQILKGWKYFYNLFCPQF